jgi:hypothetical protein
MGWTLRLFLGSFLWFGIKENLQVKVSKYIQSQNKSNIFKVIKNIQSQNIFKRKSSNR